MQKAPTAQTSGVQNGQKHDNSSMETKKETVVASWGEDGRTVSNCLDALSNFSLLEPERWSIIRSCFEDNRCGFSFFFWKLPLLRMLWADVAGTERTRSTNDVHGRRSSFSQPSWLHLLYSSSAFIWVFLSFGCFIPPLSHWKHLYVLFHQSATLREEKPCLKCLLSVCICQIAPFWSRTISPSSQRIFGTERSASFPLRGCLLSQPRFPKEADGVSAGGAQGRLPLKLSHFALLRPWVLPAPSGSVGWICRSFHGPLILKWVCGQGRERWERNTGLSRSWWRAVSNI